MAVDRSAVVKKADELVRQGKLEAAIAEYRALLDDQPGDMSAANTLGDLYARNGDIEKAVEQFIRLADSERAQGFTSKAVALFKKALKVDPNSEAVLGQLADIAVGQSLFADAARYWSRLAQSYRARQDAAGFADTLIRLASLPIAKSETRLAAARAAEAHRDADQVGRLFADAARALEKEGRSQDAVDIWIEAATRTADMEVRRAAAVSCVEHGSAARAEVFLDEAVAGDDPRLLLVVGERAVRDGRADEARRVLGRYRALVPTDVDHVGELMAGLPATVEPELQAPTFVEPTSTESTSMESTSVESASVEPVSLQPASAEPATPHSALVALLAPMGAAASPTVVSSAPGPSAQAPQTVSPPVFELERSERWDAQSDDDTIDLMAEFDKPDLSSGPAPSAPVQGPPVVDPPIAAPAEALPPVAPSQAPPPPAAPVSVAPVSATPPTPAPPRAAPGAMPPPPPTRPERVPPVPARRPMVAQPAPPVASPVARAVEAVPAADRRPSAKPPAPPAATRPAAPPRPSAAPRARTAQASGTAPAPSSTPPTPSAVPGQRAARPAVPQGAATRPVEAPVRQPGAPAGLSDSDAATIAQLQTAASTPALRFQASAQLGRLLVQRGDLMAGIEWLQRASAAPAPVRDHQLSVLYDLADALERAGRHEAAATAWADLDLEAGGYRDVPARLAAVTRRRAART